MKMVKEEKKKKKKEEEEEKEKKKKSSSIKNIINCADIKFLMVMAISLLVFFLLATLLIPYKPSNFLSSSSSSSSSSNSSSLSVEKKTHQQQQQQEEEEDSLLVVKRSFATVGSAAYLFVQMGAYRGGPNTFAVIGLSSKPLHVYSNPDFACTWLPAGASSAPLPGSAYKILPDWGYGRVYTVVVVNCTFTSPVGADGSGGKLLVTATTGGGVGGGAGEETFLALEEAPKAGNMSLYNSTAAPPRFEYLYCGSPLYGGLSPQRTREWLAYHVRLFGGEGRAHFVMHDAGGVHPEVREVLRPWVERGVVTLQDVRGQERFDGYYHNQFLVANDCLHRHRLAARWIFYFDLDEFIYVDPKLTLGAFMDSMSAYTQFTIEQMPMSAKLCLDEDAGKNWRMWGMEKLVYRDVKRGIRRDRKYAIQPRNAFAAGVHLSQNFDGKTTHRTEGKIKYFHYRGTVANRKEPCREFVNATALTFEGTPYVRDDTLRKLAGSVKMFEARTIGSGLGRTRQ